jgi:membrane-bound metal-dependent hydrolase YbcI (DUF457 family)
MLVGHYSLALIGKRLEPRLSLATTVLAAMLADFLWCVFLIAGIEEVRMKAGLTLSSGMRAIDVLEASRVAFSHSLATDIVWAGIFAGLYFLWRRDRAGAWILFALVLSHWLLDFVSHPPDMPLAPGIERYFGLGLWTSLRATLVVEGFMWLLAIMVYMSGMRSRRSAKFVFFGGAALLTLVWLGNILGPPPPNVHIIGFSSLTFFTLTVAWAFLVDRLTQSPISSPSAYPRYDR